MLVVGHGFIQILFGLNVIVCLLIDKSNIMIANEKMMIVMLLTWTVCTIVCILYWILNTLMVV
jgi:hypothetical protein